VAVSNRFYSFGGHHRPIYSNPVSGEFLAGATVRADYECVRNTIDCPERVYRLLGTEPLTTSDQTI